MNNQELIKIIDIKLQEAKRHFQSKIDVIEQAEKLLIKGLEQPKIDNAYIMNGIDILLPYISATSVKDILRLIQGQISEITGE